MVTNANGSTPISLQKHRPINLVQLRNLTWQYQQEQYFLSSLTDYFLLHPHERIPLKFSGFIDINIYNKDKLGFLHSYGKLKKTLSFFFYPPYRFFLSLAELRFVKLRNLIWCNISSDNIFVFLYRERERSRKYSINLTLKQTQS